MATTIERYSTREILHDQLGDGWTSTPRAGRKQFGHNPSWVKAVDFDHELGLRARIVALLARAEGEVGEHPADHATSTYVCVACLRDLLDT